MKTFFVDTNPFLRFILSDIVSQKIEFKKLVNQARKGKVRLVVPQIVIFEINFALQKYYKFDKQDVIDKLQTIVDTPYFEVASRDIFRTTLKIYSEHNLSLADCFIYCSTEDANAELFTFDKNLQKLSKQS